MYRSWGRLCTSFAFETKRISKALMRPKNLFVCVVSLIQTVELPLSGRIWVRYLKGCMSNAATILKNPSGLASSPSLFVSNFLNAFQSSWSPLDVFFSDDDKYRASCRISICSGKGSASKKARKHFCNINVNLGPSTCNSEPGKGWLTPMAGHQDNLAIYKYRFRLSTSIHSWMKDCNL